MKSNREESGKETKSKEDSETESKRIWKIRRELEVRINFQRDWLIVEVSGIQYSLGTVSFRKDLCCPETLSCATSAAQLDDFWPRLSSCQQQCSAVEALNCLS